MVAGLLKITGCHIWNANCQKLASKLLTNNFLPDPDLARKEFWLPFIQKLGADENTIIIGHSSGALAAMRYVEQNKILGSVLVGACYTDLNDENEKRSGYYDGSWKWDSIKKNQQWIIQFASTDDPFIPIEEARHIHEQLETEYYEYDNQGHFGHGAQPKNKFPELVEALKKRIKP